MPTIGHTHAAGLTKVVFDPVEGFAPIMLVAEASRCLPDHAANPLE